MCAISLEKSSLPARFNVHVNFVLWFDAIALKLGLPPLSRRIHHSTCGPMSVYLWSKDVPYIWTAVFELTLFAQSLF